MRDYISEKTTNMTRRFNSKFGGIDVHIETPLSDDISLERVLRTVEQKLPSAYYQDLKGVYVGAYKEFERRQVNALYKDQTLFISNEQESMKDLLDDIIHEIAHHLETKATEEIYGDRLIIREFIKKREQLNFELRSEGYWTEEYDFKDLKFKESFDDFLYKRVGFS